MPIRPENRALYPKDWKAISLRVRQRNEGRCEWCGVPNRSMIFRCKDERAWIAEDGAYHAGNGPDGGKTGEYYRGSEFPAGDFVYIVLTVAHMDHDPSNCADDNLKSLCQRCHLTYDAKHHAGTSAKTRRKKLATGDLFEKGN